jgi:hypothetical protein
VAAISGRPADGSSCGWALAAGRRIGRTGQLLRHRDRASLAWGQKPFMREAPRPHLGDLARDRVHTAPVVPVADALGIVAAA